MIFLFANFVDTTLAAPLAQDATSAFVPQSASELYPQPTGTERIAVTLQDGYQAPEIVYVSANPRTGEMVIERGKEGTSAKTWPAGSLFIHTLTKESILWFSTGGAGELIAALQAQIDAQGATIAGLQSQIDALQVYVDEQDAELTAAIEQANASITQNAQVIADTNYALAQLDTTLTAAVASNTAKITSIYSAIATNQAAQATINTNLQASINGVSGNLSSFQTVQASANAAFVSSINTLTANYGTQQAQITINATAIATINGSLSGKYLVAISAGQFASFELAAGSGTASYSYAAFNVSKLYINDPTGTYNPFRFDTGTGTAYLQNAYIQNAWVENLTLTKGKIGYGEITDRANFTTAPGTVLTSLDKYLAGGTYNGGGGALIIDTQLTVLAGTPGDSYINVSIYINGSLHKTWPWYFKNGAYDTKFVQDELSAVYAGTSVAVYARLNPGSSAAQVAIAELKLKEYMR